MIEIKNLLMSYRAYDVLNIRQLTFESGKRYGLVGHNGAGKTTLFKCITNIVCTYRGMITIDGTVVKDHNEVLADVGIVLDGMSVYRNRTGWFNIDYFSGLRGITGAHERARELAGELELLPTLDNQVKTYSYGMQKKLILLIALLHRPKILILDEPFRGLDNATVKWFKEYLKQLTNQGMTLLISSHVQNDLETLCEEVFVIDRGRIIEHIDLTVEREKLLRLIDTTDNTSFTKLLTDAGVSFEMTEEGTIRVDIAHSHWQDVSAALKSNDIEIIEMSKVKILEERLN